MSLRETQLKPVLRWTYCKSHSYQHLKQYIFVLSSDQHDSFSETRQVSNKTKEQSRGCANKLSFCRTFDRGTIEDIQIRKGTEKSITKHEFWILHSLGLCRRVVIQHSKENINLIKYYVLFANNNSFIFMATDITILTCSTCLFNLVWYSDVTRDILKIYY